MKPINTSLKELSPRTQDVLMGTCSLLQILGLVFILKCLVTPPTATTVGIVGISGLASLIKSHLPAPRYLKNLLGSVLIYLQRYSGETLFFGSIIMMLHYL